MAPSSFLVTAVAAVGAVLATTVSQATADPITFVGSPFAASSLSNVSTVLNAPASGSGTVSGSGAQFPYTKNSSISTAALATVTLENADLGGTVLTLMNGFDVLTQNCSCYWIDAADLVKLVPGGLEGSGMYYLRMAGEGGAYDVHSGYFGIAITGAGSVTVGSEGIVGTASAVVSGTAASAIVATTSSGSNSSSTSSSTSKSTSGAIATGPMAISGLLAASMATAAAALFSVVLAAL
ncbi:hypothetical protein HK405_007028 [Cladochytrium tenue]|nr:hypothetical protein HK405_007028 [Cladochytrium tenue]